MNIDREAKIIFISGTIISILSGAFLGIIWKRSDTGTLLAIGIEIVVLILMIYNRLGKINVEICWEVRKSLEILMHSQEIIDKGDQVFVKRYNELLNQIKELSEGRYTIHTSYNVYLDDRENIALLQEGEKLRSTCVISKEDATAQIKDKFYEMSIEQHLKAARNKIDVTRIYVFPDQKTFEMEEIKKDLDRLTNSGLKVRIIFRDDIKTRGIDQIDLDFLVFDQKKVSVGEIDPKDGTIKKAHIFIEPEIVKKYIRDFDILEGISDEYISRNKPVNG